MKKAEVKKQYDELLALQELENFKSNLNRSRSITIGTAFGGTTEVLMRGDGGRHLWCVLQPVEVVELIHQLAANVGCHIAIKPREDFSSWRGWKQTEEEKLHYNGHPPFVNDMMPFMRIGADPAEGITEEDLKNDEGFVHKNFKDFVYFLGSRGGSNTLFDLENKQVRESDFLEAERFGIRDGQNGDVRIKELIEEFHGKPNDQGTRDEEVEIKKLTDQ